MIKTYLLDTNVLMKYPTSIYGFDDNNVVVTATTIEELDNLKDPKNGERGFMARNALRQIDELRQSALEQKTSLSKGVRINGGVGTFHIENNHIDDKCLPQGWDIHKPDNRIIACAKNIGAILVTEDRGMSIKADELEITVQSYKNAEIEDEVYTGYDQIWIPESDFSSFFANRKLAAKESYFKDKPEPEENEYFIMHNSSDPVRTALARFIEGNLVTLCTFKADCKVKPRNVYQNFIIDALMCDDIPLVIIDGPAGLSKTFLTVAAGMQGYMSDKWSQILCTRNNVEMDSHGIGALPGDEVEKIGPLMRGILDNLRNYLLEQGTDEKDAPQSVKDYVEREIIKFEAMSFMRGRSITDTLIFLDESQNATPHQIHSIITRAGKGSKVVCAGDPSQIDDIKLDKKNNGLVFVKNNMRNTKCCAQLTINDPSALQRSELSRVATERMSGMFN